MAINNQTLKELLASDLPYGFIKELYDRLPSAYKDSYASLHADQSLGKEQAGVVLGHFRRGRVETLLEKIAKNHGLQVNHIDTGGGGIIVELVCGRFCFTMCHVSSPQQFPTVSTSRKQSSTINAHLAQQQLFAVESTPEKAEIYGIFIHTELGISKDTFGSIFIGFPDENCKNWVDDPISFIEIIELLSETTLSDNDRSSGVHPVLKKGVIESQATSHLESGYSSGS